MPRRLLLTGAGGFIGHHVLRHFLAETDWHIVATDSFRHKGKTDRISLALAEGDPSWRERLTVITHDLAAPFSSQMADRIGRIDYLIAMASESHVDRSIADPATFIRNNVGVILSTLGYARAAMPGHVIVISTDEVYGPVMGGHVHREWSPILPSNPYAASKAAQEAIAISYWRTYGLPLTVVNCMNLIGEAQDPEKYLPSLIARISRGETVTVHGTPEDIGSRFYLHARNLADALLHIFRDIPPSLFGALQPSRYAAGGRPDRFNIVGPDRVTNLELAERVAAIIGKPLAYDLVDFHSTRPGHDPHYGLDPAKLTAAGWKPPVPFAESLERTVRWTLAHPSWLAED
jgi:dTDP-glucose 4,6-dehydratase